MSADKPERSKAYGSVGEPKSILTAKGATDAKETQNYHRRVAKERRDS